MNLVSFVEGVRYTVQIWFYGDIVVVQRGAWLLRACARERVPSARDKSRTKEAIAQEPEEEDLISDVEPVPWLPSSDALEIETRRATISLFLPSFPRRTRLAET